MTEFVTSLPSHKLTPHESAVLLMVVNTVRAGFFMFQVTFTYNKVTTRPPRKAPADYQAMPGTTPLFHVGTVVAAPTNKDGEVYLRIVDAARAAAGDEYGWTAFRPEGLTSFRVLPNGVLPGTGAVAAVKAALAGAAG